VKGPDGMTRNLGNPLISKRDRDASVPGCHNAPDLVANALSRADSAASVLLAPVRTIAYPAIPPSISRTRASVLREPTSIPAT
jgi:hypothetical protein